MKTGQKKNGVTTQETVKLANGNFWKRMVQLKELKCIRLES